MSSGQMLVAVRPHLRSLLRLTLVSRACLAVLGVVVHWLFPSFDQSTSLFFPPSCSSSVDVAVITTLSPLLRWDALHLLSVARDGYTTEKTHAWYPLYPALLSALSTGPSTLLPLCSSTSLLLTAVLLNQLLFLLSIPLLYLLVLRLSSSPRLSYLSAAFFVLSPASVFLIAPYTECTFVFLSLCAFCLHERGRLLPSSCVFALAAATRSNGALYAVFPTCEALQVGWQVWRGEKRDGRGLRRVVEAGVGVLIIAVPSVLYGWWSARAYCDASSSSALTLPAYCASLLPSMYSEVQRRYWGVGFLRYYTLQQAPNFLLAAPILALSISALSSSLSFLSPSAASSSSPTSLLNVRLHPRLVPYVLLHGALLVTALTVLHVQVSTRFMSALPTVYVWMAERWDGGKTGEGGKEGRSDISTMGWWVLCWCLVYMTLGTVLFTLFLPWT